MFDKWSSAGHFGAHQGQARFLVCDVGLIYVRLDTVEAGTGVSSTQHEDDIPIPRTIDAMQCVMGAKHESLDIVSHVGLLLFVIVADHEGA